MCLAYLLAQPRCELLGIVTGTGEAEKRAMVASAMCKAVGREIPIYPGSEHPILAPHVLKFAPQAKMLSNWAHETKFPKGEAIEFMRKTIRSNPGEVTLLGIEPLTNIGLLFAIDPDIPHMLKRLVIMSGSYTYTRFDKGPDEMKALSDNAVIWYTKQGLMEMNALVDPHATAIVYRAEVPVHRSTSVDITSRLWIDADYARREFTSPVLKPVLEMAELWFEENEHVSFHDPLAAVSIFTDDIVTFQRGNVEIELQSERLRGFTYWHENENGMHEVSVDVNVDKFFQHLFDVLR